MASTLEEIKGVARNYGNWIMEHENVWGVAVTLHPMDKKTGKFTLVVMHVKKMKESDINTIKEGVGVPVIFKCEDKATALTYMKKA